MCLQVASLCDCTGALHAHRPNYDDNVSPCWRNIHPACLAFGVKRGRAITGPVKSFYSCVLFPTVFSDSTCFTGCFVTYLTGYSVYQLGLIIANYKQMHQLPAFERSNKIKRVRLKAETGSQKFFSSDLTWQWKAWGGAVEAKSEPFYYSKMFHTNNAYTLVSYCFRHKFLFCLNSS